VIRGETGHYELVAGESARGLTLLAVHHRVLIGNGILTCENRQQALARADPTAKDKGGDAARAALALVGVERRLAP
jgi:6,7-dimethyl-8-ribityllumazine synthase